jgi:uncharacterized membrane protein YdbT with pleckstrin-like domain
LSNLDGLSTTFHTFAAPIAADTSEPALGLRVLLALRIPLERDEETARQQAAAVRDQQRAQEEQQRKEEALRRTIEQRKREARAQQEQRERAAIARQEQQREKSLQKQATFLGWSSGLMFFSCFGVVATMIALPLAIFAHRNASKEPERAQIQIRFGYVVLMLAVLLAVFSWGSLLSSTNQ